MDTGSTSQDIRDVATDAEDWSDLVFKIVSAALPQRAQRLQQLIQRTAVRSVPCRGLGVDACVGMAVKAISPKSGSGLLRQVWHPLRPSPPWHHCGQSTWGSSLRHRSSQSVQVVVLLIVAGILLIVSTGLSDFCADKEGGPDAVMMTRITGFCH